MITSRDIFDEIHPCFTSYFDDDSNLEYSSKFQLVGVCRFGEDREQTYYFLTTPSSQID